MDVETIVAERVARPLLRGRLHLAGAAVMALAAPWLVAATPTSGPRIAVAVFCASVVVMLATSAAYHVFDWSPPVVRALRRADHSAIFVGIAGTYTPFLVVALDGGFRLGMLVGVWLGAVVGIVLGNVFPDAPSWARTVPYLVLGWVSVLMLPDLWRLSPTVTWLVAAGGLAYTIGAVVYARRRPDPVPGIFGYHELFHALTLVAIALHAWAVQLAVLG